MTDSEDDFISGIFNYCDRWCERCEFTARCRVFADEQAMTDEEKDPSNEAFVRSLANSLAEAQSMLVEKAEEFGIDLEPMPEEEWREIKERTDKFIDGQQLDKLARKYAFDAKAVLDEKDEWLPTNYRDDETLADVLAVIYWYQFFITAKIHRGFHSILDTDGFEDTDEIRDPQSDANGSIKIALIAIERSILAWTYLLDEGNAARIRPLIESLKEIGGLAEQKFPRARDFVRPGFDEIEAVM